MTFTVFEGKAGVPGYEKTEYFGKRSRYCLLIPVLNEDGRITAELKRAKRAGIPGLVDIAICDGGSDDGSVADGRLAPAGVRAKLVKTGPGKQGAQLRTGIHWALEEGYEGVLTIDGNNKDSIENLPRLMKKLDEGYDLVQGSRFLPGGLAVNTPPARWLAVRLIHAPVISAVARQWFTDTTNAYRGYSRRYLEHPEVQPLRDIFTGYELLAYLSVRGPQLGLAACEVPVARVYPAKGAVPTKIHGISGNLDLLKILSATAKGEYNP